MTHSILITKYILKILGSSNELNNLIPIKSIYPIDAKLGTKFPFAVIQRSAIMCDYVKDGNYRDTVTFNIIIADDNYIGSVTIADKINEVLSGSGWRDSENNIYVHDIRLQTANEELYNDTFLQQLTFTCECDFI